MQANTGTAIQPTPGKVHEGRFAGSHGNSQIVTPDGHVLARATHVGEQIVYADVPIDADASHGPGARGGGAADENPLFHAWLQEGLKLLGKRMPIEAARAPGKRV